LATFIVAQVAAPIAIGAFFDLPQPDLSRYDFVRGDLLNAIGMVLVLPLTAAIPEEILYRGFLIERLTCLTGKGRIGISLAVFVQAIVFGSVHFEWGAGGILLASIMGAVWGFAFVLCGRNLWIVILAHSVAHVALVTQLYLS
jgi:membrane protease YdiL (CAAX protease family)